MKFILFDNFRFSNGTVSSPVSFSIIPDTAIFRDSKYFIPTMEFELHGVLCLYVKVSKVGKHVSENFVSKYLDQYGFAVQTFFPQLIKQCKEQNLNTSPGYAFDNALWLSDIVGQIDLETNDYTSCNVVLNGETTTFEIAPEQLGLIRGLVSKATRLFTIKVGDVFLFPVSEIGKMLEKGDSLLLRIAESEKMNIAVN